MKSKYKGTCSETGKAISPGEDILYCYKSKKVFCKDSDNYKKTQDIRAAEEFYDAYGI
jgi:hypothetical protein